MSGGAKFEYLWQDGTKYKKPTHLPAPQYISLLMDWVESQINDETVSDLLHDLLLLFVIMYGQYWYIIIKNYFSLSCSR